MVSAIFACKIREAIIYILTESKLNIEWSGFAHMRWFLAVHITNQKLSFDIFTVGNVQNIFMELDFYLMS